MQEANKEVPTVDIDTSGPDAEVELKEDQLDTGTVETTEESSADAVATDSEEKTEEVEQNAAPEDKKETKKEELENYSKEVQRRIAKLTKKWRDAERERDEALSFARSQKEQRDALNKRYSTLEQESVTSRQEKIESLLEAQKAKLAQAREAGDTNAEIDIQKQIAQLGYEEAELKKFVPTKVEESKPMEEQFRRQTPPTPAPDPKAEAWAAKNRWFGTDKAMTYTSFDLHKTLVDEEGYDPTSDEYYEELDKRLRVEFPHKFGTTNGNQGETAKPVQTVASATRSTKTGRKTIRLTPTEVAIAKKLGVSLEDYAKQKKLMKEV
jgi:hypothetical protein